MNQPVPTFADDYPKIRSFFITGFKVLGILAALYVAFVIVEEVTGNKKREKERLGAENRKMEQVNARYDQQMWDRFGR